MRTSNCKARRKEIDTMIESPFLEEISGISIVKIIDQGQKMPMMVEVKIH